MTNADKLVAKLELIVRKINRDRLSVNSNIGAKGVDSLLAQLGEMENKIESFSSGANNGAAGGMK